MIYFYLILIVFGLMGILEVLFLGKKFERISISTITIFLIIMAGFRTSGLDFEEYRNYFEMSLNIEGLIAMGVEPAYSLINYIVYKSEFSIYVMYLLVALVSIYIKVKFMQKYSPFLMLSMVVYFSTMFFVKEMGQIRHGVAIGLVLWGFMFISEGRNKFALLTIILATLFHYSSIVALLAFWVSRKQISTRTIVIVVATFFPALFINLKPVILLIIDFMPFDVLKGKSKFYLNSSLYGQMTGLNSTVVLRLVTIAIMVYYRKELGKLVPYYNAILNQYLLGICLYFLLSSVEEFAARTSVFYRSLELIIVPSFVLLGKNTIDRVLIAFVVVLNGVYTLYKFFEAPYAQIAFEDYNNIIVKFIVQILHN